MLLLISFAVALTAVSIKYEKKLVEALPVTLGAYVLILYVLALVGALYVADYVGLVIIASGILYTIADTIKKKASADTDDPSIKDTSVPFMIAQKYKDHSIWVFIFLMVLIFIGVSSKLITWWDDYNFWGTDVKAIFYTGGLAAKYQNVAPEFGDYPPGTQLVKWMFLNLKPGSFDEGLMFTGYYFFIYSFLAPILGYFDNKGIKGIVSSIISGALLFIMPSCVEAFYLDGCCADICMAVAFGVFLVTVLKRYESIKNDTAIPLKEERFNVVSSSVALSVMMLSKNTSFIWLLYAMVFMAVLALMNSDKSQDKGEASERFKKNIKTIFGYFALPCMAFASWLVFCLLNKRVARSTVGALTMVSSGTEMPDKGRELISAYVKAFLSYPMHRYQNAIVDISPLAFWLIVTLAFILFGVFKLIDKKECIFLSCFAFAGGAVFYLIDLICHLTVFSTEMQYLDPFAMVSSIERYSSPFTFGMIMLILYVLFAKGVNWKKAAFVAAFVILCADLTSVARGFWTYRNDIDNVLAERNALVDNDILMLWNKTILLSNNADPMMDDNAHYDGSRILYVRDSSDVSWISHAYISYYMSPVSMVFDYTDLSDVDMDVLKARSSELHAGYVYVGGDLYEN
ncbi:MAG: hypothetical protein K6A38_10725 [Lachnospiraceae bacterium]|nr:hypothetical protein [Lachnospiraceae bacterium]